VAKCDDIFRPSRAGLPGGRVKVVRKINPYRLPLRQGGRREYDYPYRIMPHWWRTAVVLYMLLLLLLSIFRSNKHHQMVSLSLSLFLFFSLRVRLFCVAFAYIMRAAYTHRRRSRPIDPIQRRGGQKKIIPLLRQQNKREHLVNKKPDTIFERRREALGCRRQVYNMMFYIFGRRTLYYYIRPTHTHTA